MACCSHAAVNEPTLPHISPSQPPRKPPRVPVAVTLPWLQSPTGAANQSNGLPRNDRFKGRNTVHLLEASYFNIMPR